MISLFLDKSKLHPSYIPSRLPHREHEISRLLSLLQDGSTILVYGPVGSGTTVTVRHALAGLPREYMPIYIDASSLQQPSLVRALAWELGVVVERRPVILSVLDRIARRLRESGRKPIVAIDHLDGIASRGGLELLRRIARVLKASARATLIYVFNDPNGFYELMNVADHKLTFRPYGVYQLRDILAFRAEEAFKPDVVDEDVLFDCAAYAATVLGGGARTALELLRIAGEIAENEGSPRVLREHVERAARVVREAMIAGFIGKLDSDGRLLLKAILKATQDGRRPATTGEVYRAYRELGGRLSIQWVSEELTRMEEEGLVEAKLIVRPQRGRTRLISLKVEAETLRRLLEGGVGYG